MKTKAAYIYAVVISFIFASCGGGQTSVATEAPATEPAKAHAIVLGDISDDPAEVIEGTQPLADYLAENLKDFGITEGLKLQFRTEFFNLFNTPQFDLPNAAIGATFIEGGGPWWGVGILFPVSQIEACLRWCHKRDNDCWTTTTP